jgi:hypothetical protein
MLLRCFTWNNFLWELDIVIPGQNCVPIWRWILWAKMNCSRCPKAVSQNCVPIWRWILWAKMNCSRCPKAVSFLGADLPSLLCNLFLFYCYFFLSSFKLFFYNHVRGSNMVSRTLAYIIIIRIIIENVTGKT